MKQCSEFAARRDFRTYQLLANDHRVLAVALQMKAAAVNSPQSQAEVEEESTPAPTSKQPAVEQQRGATAPPTSSQRNSAQRRSAKRQEKYITNKRSEALLRWREILRWRPLLVRCLRLHRWHCAQKVAAAHWRKRALHESPLRPSTNESATNSPPTNPSKKKTKVFKTRQRNLLDELGQEAPPEDDHISFPPLPSRPHQP